MNAVFVDTGGWMACANRGDPAHVACAAARDATLEAGRILITTDFVVDETLALIRFRLGLAAANAWWQQLDGSAVITTDSHFRQIGFDALPAARPRRTRTRRS